MTEQNRTEQSRAELNRATQGMMLIQMRLARTFLRGSSTSNRKPSLVSWNACCKAKDNGDAVQEKQLAEWFDDQAVTGCLVSRCQQVELESDNALLIEILQMSLASVSSVVEVQLIHDLCLKDRRVKFKSIRRTNNKVADHLTKMTSSDFEHFVVLEELSNEINTFLDKNTCSSILEESISN
ncbi:hypothetical protein Gotur_024887 [Gossypium turneri]